MTAVQEQHDAVATALDRVGDELSTWVDDPTPAARDRLAVDLEALSEAAIGHMDYEERFVVPLMEEHVTMREWAACVEAARAGINPADMPLVLGMASFEDDEHLIDLSMAALPEEQRAAMRELATRAFSNHASLIHGTTMPPRSTQLAASP